MFSKTTVLAILAFSATAIAAPQIVEKNVYVESYIDSSLGIAIGGAIDVANKHAAPSPVPTPAPAIKDRAALMERMDNPPQYLTITIVNSRAEPLSTSHAVNYGAPTPIWGDNGPGTIALGGTAAFAVPTGWAGNVAIIDAVMEQDSVTPLPDNGDTTLIEASFVVPDGYSMAVVDVDVSMV